MKMEEEKVMNLNYNLMMSSSSHTPLVEYSDLDLSFTSTASVSTSTSSARSSLSLAYSFSSSTSIISPLPHSSSHNSPLWSALRAASNLSKDGSLHLRHLHLLRHLGSGHLAKVFHCRLKGSDSFDFALKVVDLNTLPYPSSSSSTSTSSSTNDHQQQQQVHVDTRLSHVRTEARVLAALDHPFLPTLYARMDASHYACFLIDYCPGGDLHSLLLRHPGHRLPISAVRFFAAEVLLALEYLHALGFVYRDLKPENVLIRSDGHIMLSDFDLCFSSEVEPSLHRRRSRLPRQRRGSSSSCFGGDEEVQEELMEFVAEPEGAFSRACVGTHEYLAPEIVSGNGHGNSVDWWAFGVFIYELMCGRTPFKGSTKEATLKNIMKKDDQAVRFPDHPVAVGPADHSAAAAARDLIRRLLVQEPKERLGSRRGAAEIKRHPFFEGVKWPLIRSMKSPVVVGPAGAVVVKEGRRGWWRNTSVLVCYKKGIKLGLGSSTTSSSRSNNNNKRNEIRKEKSKK